MFDYSSKSSMFKSSRKGIYKEPYNGKEKNTVFGFDAIKNKYPSASACCASRVLPSGGYAMNSFYPTIWDHNLQNVLIHKNAFGENCCN
jgi:predicted RNA-binding protein associated with RNAse of E/G family